MAFAQGARSGLSYVAESTFGTTPSSPSMITLPYNTHSLDLTKERLQSAEIYSDRMPRIDRHGNRTASGDIVVELRDSDYDDLIESAMFSTFDSSGVMKIGTTEKYLTIEDSATDIDQYRVFTGMGVSSMNVNVAPNQMVRCTFGLVGADMSVSGTSLDATPTDPSGGEPFDSYSGSIKEGGSTIATLTSIDFTLNNAFSPAFVIGSDAAPCLEFGRANIEGSLTAYFEDASLINKFLNETESSLEFTADDPVSGGAYTFLFPRIKINGASTPVANEQSRVITLPFVALYDNTEETNLKLTKA